MPIREPVSFAPEIQAGISTYITDLFIKDTAVHREISVTTTDQGLPQIDVRPDEGHFLMWVARLINAKKILEIGTLAGYSGTWLAQALPVDGQLITLELEQKNADIARRNFQATGVSDRVKILVGNAHESLKTLNDTFDLVFIDAEKDGYDAYLDWALEHVRIGGIIAGHNALRGGRVINANSTEDDVLSMRKFNERMATEPRLLSMLFPAGDGTVIGMVQR